MRLTSKTGLLPTAKKNVKIENQEVLSFEAPNLAVPAYFTLRPFAGVYNPFPYACSILCNHPADLEAKTIVKKAKDTWTTEGKSLIETEELEALKHQYKTNQQEFNSQSNRYENDKIPETLFRKYAETDSRPITPAPTLISEATKMSLSLRARRCVTPDPTSFIPTKEKTLLVLDLRRSHSQETIFWPGCQAEDGGALDEVSTTSRKTSLSSQTTSLKRKKTPRKKSVSGLGTTSSVKTENSKESQSKSQTHNTSRSQSPSKSSQNQEQDSGLRKSPEITPESSSSELEVVRRRGKKRKGKRSGREGREGEKEYKGIPDPGETQVSALNDSKEGSSRPSLTGEEKIPEIRPEEPVNTAIPEVKPDSNRNIESFLDFDILKQLQRQLDQEVVDSEFNAKRKMALEEALRHRVNPKQSRQGQEMKDLQREFQLPIKNSEKWLSISRVFSRRSARFELPMDSRMLNNMTPLEYVQNYVFASAERLVLYNHVFNLHKEEPEDDEETERILLGKNVVAGLGKIMGRSLTPEEAKEFRSLLDWKDNDGLDFRTFTGISATCERLLGHRFCSKMPTQEEDPRYVVEKADFETLDGKLLRLKPDGRLVKILKSIRDL